MSARTKIPTVMLTATAVNIPEIVTVGVSASTKMATATIVVTGFIKIAGDCCNVDDQVCYCDD